MIVLDCNAAFAIASGEEEGDALAALMLDGERIIAPQLFMAELANAAAKYVRGGFLSQEKARLVAQRATELIEEYFDCQGLWEEALSEAIHHKHSAYDLFYFVLARRTASTLFTLDQKLQGLCLDNGVNCICTVELD